VRNDITHFKSNEIFEGSYIPISATLPKGISKLPIAEIFTKTFMEKSYKGVLDFIDMLCQKCGLMICKECEVLDCDGRDEKCEFIIKPTSYDE